MLRTAVRSSAAGTMLAAHAVLSGLLPAQAPPSGLAELARPRSGRALQFSSYDRSGGNEDHSNWLRLLEDGTRVLAEVEGSGRITRIWSANPEGTLRIELDGQAVYDGPFAGLFDQSTPPFVRPLAGRWGGGHLSYVPMPFLATLRITSPPGPGFYYQIGVELRDEPESFAMPPGPHVRSEIDGLLAGARTRDEGETVVVHDVPIVGRRRLLYREGPGELTELRLRPDHQFFRYWGDAEADSLWLEISYDGEERPALAAPCDELFAALPAQAGDWASLRLPMPFRKSLELQVVDRDPSNRDVNADDLVTRVPRFSLDATFRPLPEGHDRRYLHGRFHRQPNEWGVPYPVLDVTGRGHFVGLFARMVGAPGQGLGFLEGDETITVDGAVAFPGTGTEDYFCGAWYFRTGTFRAPFHALAELNPLRPRVVVSRFHIADPIPFEKTFRFDLEHGGANDTAGSEYATLAFWYQDSPRGHEVKGLAAAHHKYAMVRRDTPTAPGQASALPTARHSVWAQSAFEVWPQHTEILDRGDHPDRPATRTVLPAGDLAIFPRDDSVVTLLYRGRRVHGPVWIPDPETGLRTVPIEEPLEVDEVRVEPILPAIRSWRVAGPFPGGQRTGIDRVFGPEHNSDPNQSYEDIVGAATTGWRDLPGPGTASGYVDLNPLFSPNDEVVAYAAAEVHSPADQDAVLWLGSDDAVQVFVNGGKIHEHRGLRGSGRDQDRVPVTLRKGWNRLLLKVEDYLGGWGFHARLEGAKGLRTATRREGR